MQFKQLKLFRPVSDLVIPVRGWEGKNLCLFYLPENETFLNAYRFLDIPHQYVKDVFVPFTKRPFATRLTSSYRKLLKEYKLIPNGAMIGGDYSDLVGRNFYFDSTPFMVRAQKQFGFTNYRAGKGIQIVNTVVNWIGSIPESLFHRTLLYVVNLNNRLPERIENRRIYPVYDKIRLWEKGKATLPFDQVLLYYYDYTGGKYALLYDKNSKRNSSMRFKSIMKSIQDPDIEQKIEAEIEVTSKEAPEKSDITKEFPKQEKEVIQKTVNSFIKDNGKSPDKGTADDLVTQSLFYHTTGNLIKAKIMANKALLDLDDDQQKRVVKKAASDVIPKEKISTSSNHPLITGANVYDLVDGQNPKHILSLRKREFSDNLKNDIINAFKTLNKETLPLKLKSVNVKIVHSNPSELDRTTVQRFTVILVDDKGIDHQITVDLPHMGDNGTFFINGQEKTLIAQIVTYPIFYFKPYEGRFQSSYSTMTIIDKQLKTGSYLQIFMGTYKLPLITVLAYKMGFREALKLFGIQDYQILDKKEAGAIKLPGGKYIKFADNLTQVQEDLVASIAKAAADMPSNISNIDSTDFWKETLVKSTGNRSSLYYIDKQWSNLVTPIEENLLKLRGDPTTIEGIIRQISTEAATGRVDDRNDLYRQRIRFSEVLTAQLQKQVKAAYTEYLSKRMGGDENAEFFIAPRKVFTEILASQGQAGNVQMFESINPLEELSMLMRITPLGIGGLPKADAFPEAARNIHYSYYGTVDPLETPDGANVGIQQHMTVGAAITNNRGMFAEQDRKNIKPSAILGTTAAMIPFVNHDEGARVIMAVSQAKQAFPLDDLENPAVQTGYESLLTGLLSDNFIKKCPVDGVVEEVSKNYISIRGIDGRIYTISLRSEVLKSGQGKDGLSVFKPTVKVGDKVRKEAILAEGANVKNGTISNGRNLLAAFMSWKGYNFEDGMVISESAAKKFASVHNEEYEVLLSDEDDVAYIAQLGDTLKKGDILMSYSSTISDVESYTNKRTEGGGEIVGIEIFSNLDDESSGEIPEKLSSMYTEFKSYYTRLFGKYPEGTFKQHKGGKFEGILVKFIIKQVLATSLGDKLNNRHYNKGVISIIEPDENMPMTPWGQRIDIIYNPISIINRMNPGQLLEMYTAMVSKKLPDFINKLSRSKFIDLYRKVLELLDATKDKKYTKNVLMKMKSLSDKAYDKLKDRINRDGFVPIIIPPFKSPSSQDIIKAMGLLGLKTKYPLKIKIDGKQITTSPVSVGYLYVLKLEHIGEKKIHSRGVGPYVAQTMTPTAGKKRDGGASLGEYDAYSILAYDADVLIDEFFGALSADHVTKNEMIAEIIRTGETSFKKPKTNTVRDMFVQMMHAIHLTTN